MKIYHLTIVSKNKKSIEKSINFLTKNLKLLKLNVISKNNSGKPKIKRMSVLKSPHVNKKAQEQFEFRLFLTKLIVETTQNFKILTLIKKIKNIVFSDVKIKITTIIKTKKTNPLVNSSFNLKRKNETTKFLTFLDYYGEINLV